MASTGYDIIGDIHGQVRELEGLLGLIGYEMADGAWRHPDRQAVFVGDFIDRGPGQRQVVDLVRAMTETGSAIAVMGNHEFNAIAWQTPHPGGGHLRQHSEKNRRQHQAFLDAYAGDPVGLTAALDWFRSLPLWLDLGGIRVVHACWDPVAMARIRDFQNGSTHLGDALLQAAGIRGSWQFDAVETVLKGKEVALPDGHRFHDKDGTARRHIRIRWWEPAGTYRTGFIGPKEALTHIPDDPLAGDHLIDYGHTDAPVFLGHYWLEGTPAPLADNVACLDYSVAKPGGKLVAYRWDGESVLDPARFVAFNRLDS